MKILAVGLGGAGGRIVNQLYRADRRSSKVACVEALAVDVDGESIAKLTSLPDNAKIYFSPLGLAHPDESGTEHTATIEIPEIIARVQTIATGETDAIILFLGLGGSMADAAPKIVTALRSSLTEPIFALVTLPCLSEGERISARAADTIEMIAPLLDGMIVFDNETWHKKVKSMDRMQDPDIHGVASLLSLKKKKKPPLSPRDRIFSLLNEAITRRISLILRAGEFKADGGIELAEVVLDSGEVLNTMRGMGLITIGYAVEQLPSNPLDFLSRLRPTGFFADEHMKRASRIIDLAKQAIYNEVSAPCDITSAHKALVLIAGPSHELSMKGYMTVRKWIDRSIAGLETRSGDYPVTSTKFVAIIIMLSGLENIPRIGELKEIRTQFRAHVAEASRLSETPDHPDISSQKVMKDTIRDEMIVATPDLKDRTSLGQTVLSAATISPHNVPKDTSRNRSVVSDSTEVEQHKKTTIPKQAGIPARPIKMHLPLHTEGAIKVLPSGIQKESKDISDNDRRKIELELQKQRKLAIQGIRETGRQDTGLRSGSGSHHSQKQAGTDVNRDNAARETVQIKQVIVKNQMTKKVIIHKKAGSKEEKIQTGKEHKETTLPKETLPDSSSSGQTPAAHVNAELLDTWIRQVVGQKKSSGNEQGGVLRIEETVTVTRDDALLHTDLKRGKPGKENPNGITGSIEDQLTYEAGTSEKKRNPVQQDDNDVTYNE